MNKADKLHEHVAWLRREFPTPYPAELRLVGAEAGEAWAKPLPKAQRGETYRDGRRLVVRLNKRFPLWHLHEVLNHEWAHALDWRHESLEKLRASAPAGWTQRAIDQFVQEKFHSDHFYIDLGRIERAWDHWEI